MASEEVARLIRARIDEIDEALKQYRDLTQERAELQRTLDFYDGHRTSMPLFRIVPDATARKLPSALTRFQARPDSKTSRVVEAVYAILQHTPEGAATFPSIVRMLPAELVGEGEHAKEGVRTAIKRAGGRRGVRYENGGIVRLIKSPQASTA